MELLHQHLFGLFPRGKYPPDEPTISISATIPPSTQSPPLHHFQPPDPAPQLNYHSSEYLAQILSLMSIPSSKTKPPPTHPVKRPGWTFSRTPLHHPPQITPTPLIFPHDDQLVMKILSSTIKPSKTSFSNAAIGRFFGKRPTVEWLTLQANSKWNLSKPCLLSLTNKGFFIFRFSSKEDRELALSKSLIPMQNRKLHLLPWSPSHSPFDWPSVHHVWIRIHIPCHCCSSNILLSLASSTFVCAG